LLRFGLAHVQVLTTVQYSCAPALRPDCGPPPRLLTSFATKMNAIVTSTALFIIQACCASETLHNTWSRVGFGTYRVRHTDSDHESALHKALMSGINVVDTSSNYMHGSSELLVGKVVNGLIAAGQLRRKDVKIVTKFGYMQGPNLQRHYAGLTFPETVEYQKHLHHSIHPDFMLDQLSRSLERLQVDHVDTLLLHNPEYYLKKTSHGAVIAEARAEMLRRIYKAFVALEREVQKRPARIKSYGISSNSFSLPAAHDHFLPFDSLISLAEKAATEAAADVAR